MKKIQITARTRAPEPITQSVLDKAVEGGKMRQNTDKAIRLADALRDSVETDGEWSQEQVVAAAAELRRLSEIETLYLAAMRGRHAMSEELLALTAQRDQLLEVVQKYIAWSEAENDHKGTTFWERVEMCHEVDELARAAIKAVEGEQK